jgi:hypothetical protein
MLLCEDFQSFVKFTIIGEEYKQFIEKNKPNKELCKNKKINLSQNHTQQKRKEIQLIVSENNKTPTTRKVR